MQIPGAEELTVYLEKENKTLGEYALEREEETAKRSREEIRQQMDQALAVMERSSQAA